MPVAGTNSTSCNACTRTAPGTGPERGRGHPVVVSYDPTIYQGAAAHYGRGRPAYSPQLDTVEWWEQQQDMEPELCAGLLAICTCASIPREGGDELWMVTK
jgi:hypothetical protein